MKEAESWTAYKLSAGPDTSHDVNAGPPSLSRQNGVTPTEPDQPMSALAASLIAGGPDLVANRKNLKLKGSATAEQI